MSGEVNNEDRLVMYIVIPRKLKLSIGKVGATCGHAVQLLTEVRERWIQGHHRGSSLGHGVHLLHVWRAWRQMDYGKIVLGASDEEFAEIHKMIEGDIASGMEGFLSVTVVDIGLKEVAPGSVTAVGFWPMKKSSAPDLIKRLQPLK